MFQKSAHVNWLILVWAEPTVSRGDCNQKKNILKFFLEKFCNDKYEKLLKLFILSRVSAFVLVRIESIPSDFFNLVYFKLRMKISLGRQVKRCHARSRSF